MNKQLALKFDSLKTGRESFSIGDYARKGLTVAPAVFVNCYYYYFYWRGPP